MGSLVAASESTLACGQWRVAGGPHASRICERIWWAKSAAEIALCSRSLKNLRQRISRSRGLVRQKSAWGGIIMWNQVYNPLGNSALSTIAAAIPVVTLLVLIATGKVKAHIAAIIALVLTNLIAIFVFTMPANMSIRASLLGVVSGFFPIGWIVLNVIFLYQVTVSTGRFELLKRAIGGVTEDRRLQLRSEEHTSE